MLDAASIRLRRKALPDLTADAACVSKPIRDSKSRFFPELFGLVWSACFIHWAMVACKRSSFPYGSRTCPAIVSISRLRKVREVVGPSFFSEATGKPSSSQKFSVYNNCTKDPIVR